MSARTLARSALGSTRCRAQAIANAFTDAGQEMPSLLQQRIAQVLTPEQRQYLREHRGQMRNFRARRMMRR